MRSTTRPQRDGHPLRLRAMPSSPDFGRARNPSRRASFTMQGLGAFRAHHRAGGILSDQCRDRAAARSCDRKSRRLPGRSVCLVEFGSGSSRKTDLLIERSPAWHPMCPIDISESALAGAVTRLRARFPDLRVMPVHGDFSAPLRLPIAARPQKKLGFFPGSTIGNLTHAEARDFLKTCRALLGRERCLRRRRRSEEGHQRPAAGLQRPARASRRRSISTCSSASIASCGVRSTSPASPMRRSTTLSAAGSKCISAAARQHASRFWANRSTSPRARRSTPRTRTNTRSDEFQALARSAGWLPRQVWTGHGRRCSACTISCRSSAHRTRGMEVYVVPDDRRPIRHPRLEAGATDMRVWPAASRPRQPRPRRHSWAARTTPCAPRDCNSAS